jgi:hypothetical protein
VVLGRAPHGNALEWQKLRRSMIDPQRDPLEGVVESRP